MSLGVVLKREPGEGTMGLIEHKVFVCPVHGEVRDVVGMGRDRKPLHVGSTDGCGAECEVITLTDCRGAVEAERAEIITLLQEIADAEPRMSEARIAVLSAAKRIHQRGR